MGFLFSLVCNVLIDWLFLGWARRETDTRLGKMQDAAFDTPGAQSPVPASVLAAAGALALGQWAVARSLWKLSGRQAVAGLILGACVAGGGRILWPPGDS
ncbi:MAG: hypothetical protein WBO46_19510 [Caldilineaceae bacterium]